MSVKNLAIRLLSVWVLCWTACQGMHGAEWRLHPAFDRSPVRIMDTPEKTYFLVHQQIYHRNIVGYDFPSLALFCYVKSSPEKGICPLTDNVCLSSSDIRLADYSPYGKYMIVAYNGGGLDIVDNSGRVSYINRLRESSVPGFSIVNSITFEPSTGDAWVATDAGYVVIDASTFRIKEESCLYESIDRICRVGTKVIAMANGSVWESDNAFPQSFSEFKKIPEIKSPLALMPLSSTCFAYLSGTPRGNNILVSANLVNNEWVTSTLCNDVFYCLDNENTLVNGYEANIIPNQRGYLLYSATKAWQLTVSGSDGLPSVFQLNRDDTSIPLGSWDFKDFWTYKNRGMFISRRAEYDESDSGKSVVWNDKGDPIRPEAPAAFISTYMGYSEDYGQLVMNHGHEWELGYNAPVNPPLLSCYKEGRWQIKSHAYQPPNSVMNNNGLQSVYSAYINRFPLHDPNGLLVDPVNPDWIVCGSMFGGIMFQDLSDIGKDVIRFGAGNDLFKNFPGFVPVVPVQTWGTLSCFSPPACDSRNVVWSVYSNAFESQGSSPKAQLKYMTEEKRRKLFSISPDEINAQDNWETIMLPVDNYPDWNCKVVASSHHKNQNLVIVCINNYDGDIIILDHKGTLDDTTDDEYKIFSKIRSKADHVSSFTQINNIVEDPLSGEILVSTTNSTFVFDPASDVKDGIIRGETLRLKGGNSGDIIPESCHVNKIVFDDECRMWIATNNQGVVGVSSDRGDVIARYNVSNSPIPSNRVYGLGWNPASRSLMISTKLGLAEVFPDIAGTSFGENTPSLNISEVTPDYNGNVIIRNLSPRQDVVVRNIDGEEVRRLNSGNLRNIEWNLKDSTGKRVKAGTYHINVSGDVSLEIVIMSD